MKTKIIKTEGGEAFLVLPDEVLAALSLKEGDALIAEARPGLIEFRRLSSVELQDKD